MTDQAYRVSVYQKASCIEIAILEQSDDDGFISAIAEPSNFYVYVNLDISGSYTPTETRAIANWFSIAAQAIEALQSLIKGPDDLRHQYEAEMAGQTVTIRKVEK